MMKSNLIRWNLFPSSFNRFLGKIAYFSKKNLRPPQDRLEEKDIEESFCRGSGPGSYICITSSNSGRVVIIVVIVIVLIISQVRARLFESYNDTVNSIIIRQFESDIPATITASLNKNSITT